MKTVEKQKFDGERAVYGEKDLLLKNCSFDGPQDGESALKECSIVRLEERTVSSAEFGWSVRDCIMKKCTAESVDSEPSAAEYCSGIAKTGKGYYAASVSRGGTGDRLFDKSEENS